MSWHFTMWSSLVRGDQQTNADQSKDHDLMEKNSVRKVDQQNPGIHQGLMQNKCVAKDNASNLQRKHSKKHLSVTHQKPQSEEGASERQQTRSNSRALTEVKSQCKQHTSHLRQTLLNSQSLIQKPTSVEEESTLQQTPASKHSLSHQMSRSKEDTSCPQKTPVKKNSVSQQKSLSTNDASALQQTGSSHQDLVEIKSLAKESKSKSASNEDLANPHPPLLNKQTLTQKSGSEGKVLTVQLPNFTKQSLTHQNLAHNDKHGNDIHMQTTCPTEVITNPGLPYLVGYQDHQRGMQYHLTPDLYVNGKLRQKEMSEIGDCSNQPLQTSCRAMGNGSEFTDPVENHSHSTSTGIVTADLQHVMNVECRIAPHMLSKTHSEHPFASQYQLQHTSNLEDGTPTQKAVYQYKDVHAAYDICSCDHHHEVWNCECMPSNRMQQQNCCLPDTVENPRVTIHFLGTYSNQSTRAPVLQPFVHKGRRTGLQHDNDVKWHDQMETSSYVTGDTAGKPNCSVLPSYPSNAFRGNLDEDILPNNVDNTSRHTESLNEYNECFTQHTNNHKVKQGPQDATVPQIQSLTLNESIFEQHPKNYSSLQDNRLDGISNQTGNFTVKDETFKQHANYDNDPQHMPGNNSNHRTRCFNVFAESFQQKPKMLQEDLAGNGFHSGESETIKQKRCQQHAYDVDRLDHPEFSSVPEVRKLILNDETVKRNAHASSGMQVKPKSNASQNARYFKTLTDEMINEFSNLNIDDSQTFPLCHQIKMEVIRSDIEYVTSNVLFSPRTCHWNNITMFEPQTRASEERWQMFSDSTSRDEHNLEELFIIPADTKTKREIDFVHTEPLQIDTNKEASYVNDGASSNSPHKRKAADNPDQDTKFQRSDQLPAVNIFDHSTLTKTVFQETPVNSLPMSQLSPASEAKPDIFNYQTNLLNTFDWKMSTSISNQKQPPCTIYQKPAIGILNQSPDTSFFRENKLVDAFQVRTPTSFFDQHSPTCVFSQKISTSIIDHGASTNVFNHKVPTTIFEHSKSMFESKKLSNNLDEKAPISFFDHKAPTICDKPTSVHDQKTPINIIEPKTPSGISYQQATTIFHNQKMPFSTLDTDMPTSTFEQTMLSGTLRQTAPSTMFDQKAQPSILLDTTLSCTFQQKTPTNISGQMTATTTSDQKTLTSTCEQTTPTSTFEQKTPMNIFGQMTPATMYDQNTSLSTIDENKPKNIFGQMTPTTTCDQTMPTSTIEKNMPTSIFDRKTSTTIFDQRTPASSVDKHRLSNISHQMAPTSTFHESSPISITNIFDQLTPTNIFNPNTPIKFRDQHMPTSMFDLLTIGNNSKDSSSKSIANEKTGTIDLRKKKSSSKLHKTSAPSTTNLLNDKPPSNKVSERPTIVVSQKKPINTFDPRIIATVLEKTPLNGMFDHKIAKKISRDNIHNEKPTSIFSEKTPNSTVEQKTSTAISDHAESLGSFEQMPPSCLAEQKTATTACDLNTTESMCDEKTGAVNKKESTFQQKTPALFDIKTSPGIVDEMTPKESLKQAKCRYYFDHTTQKYVLRRQAPTCTLSPHKPNTICDENQPTKTFDENKPTKFFDENQPTKNFDENQPNITCDQKTPSVEKTPTNTLNEMVPATIFDQKRQNNTDGDDIVINIPNEKAEASIIGPTAQPDSPATGSMLSFGTGHTNTVGAPCLKTSPVISSRTCLPIFWKVQPIEIGQQFACANDTVASPVFRMPDNLGTQWRGSLFHPNTPIIAQMHPVQFTRPQTNKRFITPFLKVVNKTPTASMPDFLRNSVPFLHARIFQSCWGWTTQPNAETD